MRYDVYESRPFTRPTKPSHGSIRFSVRLGKHPFASPRQSFQPVSDEQVCRDSTRLPACYVTWNIAPGGFRAEGSHASHYAGEGLKGLLKEGGSSRRTAVEKLFESVGGTVETFYYAFGDTGVFIIADVPDNVSAAALSLTVNATGVVTTKVTVFPKAEEIDAAAKKTLRYRAPGT